MAITITSRFTPLTYDEITRPLIEQTRAQEEMENAYMEDAIKASEMLAQVNPQTDSIAYSRLKQYSDALNQQAESLMRNGLSGGSRRSLMNMRKRYAQDIVPVQNAIARRNELMEERRKLRLANPDMIQERDVISLNDLLQNPQMDFGSTINGSEYRNRAAQLVQAIGKSRQSLRLGQNLDKYTQQIISQSGLTADEIMNGGDAAVTKALQNLYSSSGVEGWNNAAAKNAVLNYINEGALLGAGSMSINTQVDRNALRQDQLSDYARQLNDYREKLKIQRDFAEGKETLWGVTAHEAGYHVGEDGRKVKIYQDEDGNYYTKDASANGKSKRFVPTDLKPTTTSTKSSGSGSKGAGYVSQSNYIQIIGGTPYVTEKEDNMESHKGDGSIVKFSNMNEEHRNQVLNALGITIPDSYGKDKLQQLYQELDKYYIVQERVAAEKHKDSAWDWVDIRPRSNTREVGSVGSFIVPENYDEQMSQVLQALIQQYQGQQE